MIDPLKVALFVVLSIVAVVASLHAWRLGAKYGLYRFLAFESLVLVIVWNAQRWFRDPFSASQIASWVVFMASMVLAFLWTWLTSQVRQWTISPTVREGLVYLQ